MTKEYTYKRQGDGRDSWVCEEKDINGNIINKYMVYEDPNKEKLSLTDDELIRAFHRLKELNIIN